jgi:deoxyuridine 5'-triphosphate nucleotidohydrolase
MNVYLDSTIKFYISRDVTYPSRAFKHDAGIDFFVPTFSSQFINDLIEKNAFLVERKTQISSLGITASGSYCVSSELQDDGIPVIKYDVKEKKMYIPLSPGERILIPSGVYCKMQHHDRALIAANKSGIASKYGLIFGSQVVDSGYQGEIHISVINTSNSIVKIYEGMKLIQFIETPIYTSTIEFEKGLSELYSEKSDRGDGGFGSSEIKKP